MGVSQDHRLLADDAIDPFAAIFGTRRGSPERESKYLALADDLGDHGIGLLELAGHPDFQPILISPLFRNDGEVSRLHLGLSDHFGDMQFAVMLAQISREPGADVPLDSRVRCFERELDEAIYYASAILDGKELLGPGAIPFRCSISFTAEAFDEVFKKRLQEDDEAFRKRLTPAQGEGRP